MGRFLLPGQNQNRSLNSLQMAILANLDLWDAGRLISVCCAPVLAVCLWPESWAMRLTAGWGSYCPAPAAAGRRVKVNIREYGFNALLSLRLESFGIWSAEFTQTDMTGLDASWTGPDDL